jgi:hypothetical protein
MYRKEDAPKTMRPERERRMGGGVKGSNAEAKDKERKRE